MVTQQLSIFLENRQGRLAEVASLLAAHGINMTAWSVAESSEFGLLRAIVSQPQRALEILHENHYAAGLTPVLGISLPNRPGTLSRILDLLNEQGIFIEYMYAFAGKESGQAIICPTDLDRCLALLKEKEVEILPGSYLYSL